MNKKKKLILCACGGSNTSNLSNNEALNQIVNILSKGK